MSDLGSYLYHCGSYPAHLHENGVCPYKSDSQQNSSQSSSSNNSSGNNAANQTNITTDLMNSYQAVFDSDYYYSHNNDLQSTIGGDKLKLFEHFCTTNMKEGRAH